MATSVARAADLLRVLGDPTRLELLAMLQERELCVCELVAAFPISQPAVSAHLRRLRDAGLVHDERRGMWVYYRAADELPAIVRAVLVEVVPSERRSAGAGPTAEAVRCAGIGPDSSRSPEPDERPTAPSLPSHRRRPAAARSAQRRS